MGERIEILDALRALAAVWVCLFHFTSGTGIGAHGYLGVTIFFVISGFVVPYAMTRRGYTLAAWPRFMVKRLIRLEPTYLVSIALILALGAWDAVCGTPPTWSAVQIAGHLGYANALLGLPWLNAPYWSLAVEFQFYVSMGLALPLLMRAGSPVGRLGGLGAASCLPLLLPRHSNATVLPFLPVFAAGTLTFLLARKMIGRRSYWTALVVLGGIVFVHHDAGAALATTGTAALIATVRMARIAPIAWLGSISYSLYLLHVPIGYRVSGMIRRAFDSESAPILLTILPIIVPLAASLAAAAVLHRYVERPSLRLAARIGYRAAGVARAAGPAAPESSPTRHIGHLPPG
jgi:peptidoglycan/LPS O-acetylase OafA/YrhL